MKNHNRAQSKGRGVIGAALLVLLLLGGCAGSKAVSPQGAGETTESAVQSDVSQSNVPQDDTLSARETEENTNGESGAYARVADASDMTAVEAVGEEGMPPVYGSELRDGTYAVEAESSSSMFAITACSLTVADGKLTARLTMGGTGYLYVYPGTAEEAAKEKDTGAYISYEEEKQPDGGVRHSFTIPVEALDQGFACAAFSKKKEMWYDRTLFLRAASLPAEAFLKLRYATAESLSLADGFFTSNALVYNEPNRTVVIFNINPVANIVAFSVNRKIFSVFDVRNHKRKKFFWELERSVVICTVRKCNWKSVCMEICHYNVVTRSFT